jgi:adenylate cyclase
MSRRRLIPVRRVALIVLAASALLLSPAGLQLEETLGLPLLFSLRGERTPPPAVALVALDEASAVALDLPDLDQIDRWPRRVHAQLIRRLHRAGAAVVALDIAFLAPGDPAADADLAAALREAGNVTLLKLLERINAPPAGALWQSEPLPLVAEHAAAVNVFTLPDRAIKRYAWLFPRTPAGIEASMPLVALQLYHADARATLLEMLRERGEQQLAQALDAETQPARFAARVRDALLNDADLAYALMSRCDDWPDRSAAQRLRILLRAWQTPDPVYIDFYGPQRAIHTVSLHDALRNDEALSALRDKVVFVGVSERHQKQRDYFFTAYPGGGSRVSGVEIAATLFANLLEGRTLHTPPPWLQLIGLWLWGGALLFAAHRVSASRWLLITLALATAYGVFALAIFALTSLWLPLIVPLLLTAAFALLAIWHFYLRSHQGERAAKTALSLYVPDDIAATIGYHRERLLSQRREFDAVCLLTDIVGFTALSEQREAGYMHELMNRYYTEIVAEVERRGGVVANIVGDGLLALWPIGANGERDAVQRACETALAIVATSDRLSAQLAEPLTTCVGLHAGPLSLGHLGAGKHFEYAPVGDTINTTARIEACTRQLECRILLSDCVRPWIGERVVRTRGEFALKGKHDALILHELVTDTIKGSHS